MNYWQILAIVANLAVVDVAVRDREGARLVAAGPVGQHFHGRVPGAGEVVIARDREAAERLPRVLKHLDADVAALEGARAYGRDALVERDALVAVVDELISRQRDLGVLDPA